MQKTRRQVLKLGGAVATTGLASSAGAAKGNRGKSGRKEPVGRPVVDPEPGPAPSIYIDSDMKEFNWLVLLGNEREAMADALLGSVDSSPADREQTRVAREAMKDIWSEIEIKSKTKPWRAIARKRDNQRDSKSESGVGNGRSDRGRGANPAPGKEGKTTVYSLKTNKKAVRNTLMDAESKVRESQGFNASSVRDDDAASLTGLSNIIGRGMNGGDKENDNQVGIQWKQEPNHNKMSRWAAWMGAYQYKIDWGLANDIGEWSEEPDEEDEMDYDPVPTGPIDWDIFPEPHAQAYAHSWNPDPADYWIDEPLHVGGGPRYTHDFMKEAEQSNGSERFRKLAYAMHIVEDLGNPLHTGAWLKGTALNRSIHRDWEDAVADRFESDFLPEIQDLDNFYVVEDSPWYTSESKYEVHAATIGQASHDYSGDVQVAVAEAQDANYRNDYIFERVGHETRQCLEWGVQYAAGLAAELTGRT